MKQTTHNAMPSSCTQSRKRGVHQPEHKLTYSGRREENGFRSAGFSPQASFELLSGLRLRELSPSCDANACCTPRSAGNLHELRACDSCLSRALGSEGRCKYQEEKSPQMRAKSKPFSDAVLRTWARVLSSAFENHLHVVRVWCEVSVIGTYQAPLGPNRRDGVTTHTHTHT